MAPLRSLASAVLLLSLPTGMARAGTIIVDDAFCPLPNAILSANTDTPIGECDKGQGNDILLLAKDVVLTEDLPTITGVTTISPLAGHVIDGGGHACIHVGASADVTLVGLTLQNCAAERGGAVFNENELTISSCTIAGNTSASDGGGILNAGDSLTMTNSTITGNTAGGAGGGIAAEMAPGAYLDLESSTVSGNTATLGAGLVFSGGGTLQITQSTVSGNTAVADGGGLYVETGCTSCNASLLNATLSGNVAGGAGGGIALRDPLPFLTLSHCLISGNTATLGAEMFLDPAAPTIANAFNVVGYDGEDRSEGFTPGATDIVPAQGVALADILGPLADNGGLTLTHALAPGSPAVDAIPTSDAYCSGTTDQRGTSRPVGSGCDSGSFELDDHIPFGGSVSGIVARIVTCQNKTTRRKSRTRPTGGSWNCEDIGIRGEPGETVKTWAMGTVARGDDPIGGTVTGVSPLSVFCENISTGASVRVATNVAEWDCRALGLAAQAGDTVSTGATGVVVAGSR